MRHKSGSKLGQLLDRDKKKKRKKKKLEQETKKKLKLKCLKIGIPNTRNVRKGDSI